MNIQIAEYRAIVRERLSGGGYRLTDHTNDGLSIIGRCDDVVIYLNSIGIKIDAVTHVDGRTVLLTTNLTTQLI